MALRAFKRVFTPQEYLTLERQAATKSEFFDGEIYAMAGASRKHNLITLNAASELRRQLRGRPCEVYVAEMRVRVGATGLYTYPDASVVCGQPVFEDIQGDTLLNPTVLIEVLSPSTEAYDRGEKFSQYRRLASLREYVLIAQDRVLVEHYRRRGDLWVIGDLRSLADVLHLESIDCQIPLNEIYYQVEMEA
ncbi:MAG: Uma2 family endonuclease [Caldilineales bacterium]|nr:Uma2 family endonuclease [Caldilineales bacterium]MCW5861031.1 Uma2 family endonuclease [Caldilineales bacterium]